MILSTSRRRIFMKRNLMAVAAALAALALPAHAANIVD
jgi:hypothetical protein